MARIYLTHHPEALETYFGQEALGLLRNVGEVVLNPYGRQASIPEMIEAAKDADFILSFRADHGPAQVFDKLPKLVAFCRAAVDIRDVDVEAASRNGVMVCQARPHFVAATAEMTIGLMIAAGRDIGESVVAYRTGKPPISPMGRQLAGATAGIVGYGRIVKHMIPILRAFGMRVLINLPHRRIEDEGIEQVDFATLLAQSDYVLPLAVANEKTENLMNAAAFAQMKPGAIFVNASRGNLVDEQAMVDALKSGRIRAIGLDVGRAADQRPTPEIAAMENVVAAPHLGGATPENVFGQAKDAVEQIDLILRGETPPLAVNAERASRAQRFRKA